MTVVLVVLAAVLVVGWLTAAAAAVRYTSRIWLRHWVEQGGRGSDAVWVYLERPHRLLLAAGTAVMLTVVLAGIGIGAADDVGALREAGRLVASAVALLLAGQLLPGAIGRRWSVALVPVLVPVLRVVDVVLGPVADAVRRFAARGGTADDAPEPAPRDALEDLLREGELEGVSAGEEAAIISGIVQFGDKRVREVMTPRDEMFVVDGGLDLAELARRVVQSGYSRVPVCDGSLDSLTGMVHVFDLIKAAGERPPRWRALAETTPDTFCHELLGRMLRGQLHLSVVRDQHGRTLGLVTLEDLLEELVGDIRDEHDEPAESATPADPAAPLPPPTAVQANRTP